MGYEYRPPSKDNISVNASDVYSNVGKNRIYRLFKPTIELDELSLRDSGTNESQNASNLMGIRYPVIKINDYMITEEEIDDFSIDCTGFLPSITLRVTFTHQNFISKEMPKDGDVISVAILNKSDFLNVLRNDYVITNVMCTTMLTNNILRYSMSFFGKLFVPGLSSSKINLSYEGTSFEALKDCAKALGLGFATNEDDTDDKQVWLSGRDKLYQYINKTIKRAWKDEKSFYDAWIDVYYNLNFINVNKQLMSAEDKVDIGVWLNAVDYEYEHADKVPKTDSEVPKVLSNYIHYRASSFFINSWKVLNRSTSITFDIGTKVNGQMFEHNVNLYADKDMRKYWNLEMEPIYDQTKVRSHILLRGRPNRPDGSQTEHELQQANYSYPSIYESRPWLGVQYTITNPKADNLQWDGNQHRNYLRAGVQNILNNKEIDKMTVTVNVNGTNLNVLRGDKVPIAIIKTDRVENMLVDKMTEGFDRVDNFYSGWYYVKGFIIGWNKENEKSLMSNFKQTFVLARREWPTPIPTKPIENKG